MKKQLACILACALALGGMALYGYGKEAKDSPAEETALPDVQVNEAASALPSVTSVTAPSVNGDYQSPLVTLRADPYLYKHTDGTYYFTGSYPEYDRIELTCADSVNGIAAAVPKTIWKMPTPPSGEKRYVWAPELHYVMGEWVIYYAYSVNSEWAIKCCALRLKGDDPMHDEWEEMGVIEKVIGDNFSFNNMSLDMTPFEAGGKWYVIWAQKPSGISNLYLAQLKTPFALATKPILLTKPDYGWEKEREDVNEGPAVMKHAGKIFVSYSASATGYEYCMGLLEIDETDDPMIIGNWTKYSEPVFKTNEALKIYGPGHNCFVKGDEGEQLCVLHFRSYKEIIGGNGNSLYDFNRHAHVMKITFDNSGKPIFNLDSDELYNTEFTNHGK